MAPPPARSLSSAVLPGAGAPPPVAATTPHESHRRPTHTRERDLRGRVGPQAAPDPGERHLTCVDSCTITTSACRDGDELRPRLRHGCHFGRWIRLQSVVLAGVA